MRVLFDECVPRPLRRHLSGHVIWTVPEMGWSGKKNGALLALLPGSGFEVLLTVDKSLRYQQNPQALVTAGVALVVIDSITNDLADLLPFVPAVLAVLSGPVNPGDVIEVR